MLYRLRVDDYGCTSNASQSLGYGLGFLLVVVALKYALATVVAEAFDSKPRDMMSGQFNGIDVSPFGSHRRLRAEAALMRTRGRAGAR